MNNNLTDRLYKETEYEHRFMLALILSELLLIAVFRLWPAFSGERDTPVNFDRNEEVYVEEVINTKQTAPASPPKPQVPVPVPNDEVIEEEIEFPEFEDYVTDPDILESLSLEGDGEGEVVSSPQKPPTISRIVEASVRESDLGNNLKMQILVTMLVNTSGNVEEAFISEIRKYNGDTYEVIRETDQKLMAATIEAAMKWKFKPATHNGKKVKAYTTQYFSFGFQ